MHKTVKPISQRQQYNPSELVEFQIAEQQVDYQINSFYISGYLNVVQAATPANYADGTVDVRIDQGAGIHSCFSHIVSYAGGSILESFQFVPRYIAMKDDCTESDQSRGSKLSNVLMLKSCSDANKVIIAEKPRSFYTKLPCVFNRTSRSFGADEIPEVKVSISLANANRVLYGNDAGTYTYYLSDLQLHYTTMPLTKKTKPLLFDVISCVRGILDSPNSNFQYYNIAPSYSLAMSFNSLANETAVTGNYIARADPSISKVEFTVNDIQQNLIAFPFDNEEEILHNYQMSMTTVGDTNTIVDKPGVGLNLVVPIPNSTVAVNIESGALSNNQYAVYAYTHSQLALK